MLPHWRQPRRPGIVRDDCPAPRALRLQMRNFRMRTPKGSLTSAARGEAIGSCNGARRRACAVGASRCAIAASRTG